jgi:hypothetical protein
VLPIISGIVLFLVGPFPVAVGFLSRSFLFRHDKEKATVGRGRRREKEGEDAGKHALLIKLRA